MSRHALCWLSALAPLMVACAQKQPAERLGERQDAIINGVIDSEHRAVVQLWGDITGCSGTIIHVDGDAAYALTAAHCFDDGPIKWLVIGDDYNAPEVTLDVSDSLVHERYDSFSRAYDLALLTASGADDTTPVIEVLRPEADDLEVGASVVHVGYGVTAFGDNSNSLRRRGAGLLDTVRAQSLGYPQPDEGPCLGDSGGPNLYATPDGERVAGVSSFGDEQCVMFGWSSRASAVYDDWIAPYIGNPDPAAGGAGAGGGSGASGGGWVGPSGPGGDEASDGCSVGAPGGGGAGWRGLLLGLLWAMLATFARRRY